MKKFETINVIPFIDIMLVLLVIVLTTATFINTGLMQVSLPKAEQAKTSTKQQESIITITKEGEYFLNKKKLDKTGLKAFIQALSAKTSVIIRSDKKTDFEHVVFVMDLLKAQGHQKLFIQTTND